MEQQLHRLELLLDFLVAAECAMPGIVPAAVQYLLGNQF
jgi:hypothetical protein